METKEIDAFILEGVVKYGEAQATIRAFKAEMGERFKAWLLSGREWTLFVPNSREDAVWTEWGGNEQQGDWLASFVSGTIGDKHKVDLEVGIWWDPPEVGGIVAYAGFWTAPDRIKAFTYDGRNKAIVREPHRRARTRLLLQIGPADDYLGKVDAVLDEVERHTAALLGLAR